ncbi:MAG: diaminopimelate epimerase [Proteobacteria bacterium]|jgi:diaminopimelate epimerase|nr:diaminopimelate epimerase [Pseudomonadota bacterium]
MAKIQFTKMHGLGNDFVVIDNTTQNINLTTADISFICDRKIGIGCDQLLLIKLMDEATHCYQYRVFNSDGSEVEHCGNGARCVVQYVSKHHKIDSMPIILHTQNRVITGIANKKTSVSTISMGTPVFMPEEIPFIHKYHKDNIYELKFDSFHIICGLVSMGNPHVIVKLYSEQELEDTKNLEEIAKAIQHSKYFPDGVNVNFYFKLTNNSIKLITYERGSGFTLACGTGSCATAAYGILQNELDNIVTVSTLGGDILIEWDQKNELKMTGGTKEVYQGSFSL